MINLKRQNDLNQKLLKQREQFLNMNKSNQNRTEDEAKTGGENNDSFDDQLSFADEHLMPTFHSSIAYKPEKTEGVFSPEEISDIASKNGLDKDEIERLVEHYIIQNTADYDQPGKMRIGSFLKNHAGFLYSEGLLKQDEDFPPKRDIVALLKEYFKNNIGSLPLRPGTNVVDMNEMYKELIQHISKI